MYEVMLLVSVVVFVAVIVAYVRTGLASVFHPMTIYLACHGVIFVLRPIVVWVRDYRLIYNVYGFNPSMSDRLTVLAGTSLGLVCFAFACLRTGNIPMIFKADEARNVERRRMGRLLPLMMAVCVPLGLYSLLTAVNSVVQDNITMVSTATGYRINTTGVGYFNDAMFLLVPICGMFAWFYRFRWYAWLPLILFFPLKASTGGRSAFVIAVVATGLFYLYDRRIRWPGLKLLVGGVVLAMAFNAVGSDRGYALRQMMGFQNKTAAYSGRELRFMEGMDFANMEYFEYLVYVIPQRSKTYDYFLSNLQLLTEPVPRVLWSGKPAGPPIQLIHFYDYGTPYGMSYSVPGVGWFEAGWLGIVIWSMFWGWASGAIYRKFVSGSQSSVAVSLYMAFLPLLIVGYRDGTILTVARQAVFYMAPGLMLLLLGRLYRVPSLAAIGAALNRRFAQQQGGAGDGAGPVTSRGRLNRLRLIAGATQEPSRG